MPVGSGGFDKDAPIELAALGAAMPPFVLFEGAVRERGRVPTRVTDGPNG
jgi:hypothetical protein